MVSRSNSEEGTRVPTENVSTHWFALHVKSRHEKLVSSLLRAKGFEEYLPLYTVRGRYREARLPLFPCYTFCRFALSSRPQIVRTPGVFSILGSGNGPVPVPDVQIADVKNIENSGLPAEPCDYMMYRGQTVEIQGGPLTGLRGILTQIKRRHRLVLSVELLKRSVAVEVEPHWIALEPQSVLPRKIRLASSISGSSAL